MRRVCAPVPTKIVTGPGFCKWFPKLGFVSEYAVQDDTNIGRPIVERADMKVRVGKTASGYDGMIMAGMIKTKLMCRKK